MARDIKKELLEISGSAFIEWYSSLTKFEKIEYKVILEQLSEEFKKYLWRFLLFIFLLGVFGCLHYIV